MRGNIFRQRQGFLREFYGRIQGDGDFNALTVSEAIAAAGEIPQNNGIFPAHGN